ncbi:hypothetical protein RADP37_05447 (plasmid) [Roseomonas mucosa]|uniref:Uncharacterized protein n=1 Tax=Roseomonas mucosa TaxID=207340 RepID=A0A4Y1MQC5_9PROT|nr:hypothetical protein RADP37_05447 [Roseomonas mucosa]
MHNCTTLKLGGAEWRQSKQYGPHMRCRAIRPSCALPPGTLLPPNSMAFRAVLGADLRRRMDEAELIADPETREAPLFACRALLALSEAVPTAEEGGHA